MNTEFLMDDYCFACGSKNSNGLNLKIKESAKGVEAVIHPPPWSQGYHKTVHGGIISAILDEMTIWAAFKKGYKCVTAELNVRITKAMKIDDEYIAQAKVVNSKHRLVLAEATLMNSRMELIASARAKLMKIAS